MTAVRAAAALLLLSLAAPGVTPAIAAPARGAQPTHCLASERTLYSCDFGNRVVSVCRAGSQLTYRYGPLSRPEIAITSNGHDGHLHQGEAFAVGGDGNQVALRFSRGGYDYIVFSSQGDQQGLSPGVRFNGLSVMHGDTQVLRRLCPDRRASQLFTAPDFVEAEPGDDTNPWR